MEKLESNIKAVVIDVDDTLCLTEAACFDLENEALRRVGRLPMERAVHLATWGQPLFEAIKERSPGLNVDVFATQYHPVVEEFVASGRLDVIPDANYAALDSLITDGKDIMLLTSRTFIELKHMLEPDHLLASRVKSFYHKDNTAFHKPDPRAFDELFTTHGFAPDECVYIGDSPTDAHAANGAGMHFIASLESGIRQQRDFADFTVDAFVHRFPDIVDTIAMLER
jgi:phosphoglycolate phosphatase